MRLRDLLRGRAAPTLLQPGRDATRPATIESTT
jgi:hypothetical protein